MKILIIVDKIGSAIDRLACGVKEHNPHLDIEIADLHPKRPDQQQVEHVRKLVQWCDLIDVHYWKSGEVAKELFGADFEMKPKIVCHFNPYDVGQRNWMLSYNMTVVGNESIHSAIPYSRLIPYCVDLDFFSFNESYTTDKTVMMSVARIEGKKGVREVAKACNELGYKFLLIGRVSDSDYMRQVIEAAGPRLEFMENATDIDLRNAYHRSALLVCNSIDGFESGTLPIIEAMACGTPVLTRNIGHVPELSDGKNMIVREGQTEDMDNLKEQLKSLMENDVWREKLRQAGWKTIKNRPIQKMAIQYADVYYQVLSKTQPTVSVIVPTYDRPDVLVKCLAHIAVQDYPSIEVVVIDGGPDKKAENQTNIANLRKQVNVPIRYIPFDSHGEYSLAKARNMGIVEARGQIVVFCDERIGMKSDAVRHFVSNLTGRRWLWGVKDGFPKPFVENFSAITRSDIIKMGMFNERMNTYGGMSEDCRIRASKFNLVLEPCNQAHAVGLASSHSQNERRGDIVKSKLLIWKLYDRQE